MKRAVGIVIGILLITGLVYFTTLSFPLTGHMIKADYNEQELSDFISCLNKQTKLYLTPDCPEFKKQQTFFKNLLSVRDYKVCTPEICSDSCLIWEIGEKKYSGFQNLQKLSLISGCQIRK